MHSIPYLLTKWGVVCRGARFIDPWQKRWVNSQVYHSRLMQREGTWVKQEHAKFTFSDTSQSGFRIDSFMHSTVIHEISLKMPVRPPSCKVYWAQNRKTMKPAPWCNKQLLKTSQHNNLCGARASTVCSSALALYIRGWLSSINTNIELQVGAQLAINAPKGSARLWLNALTMI